MKATHTSREDSFGERTKFHSCNVNFDNKPRYTTYSVSYKAEFNGILLEPSTIFFTLKNFFLCNQDGICLN